MRGWPADLYGCSQVFSTAVLRGADRRYLVAGDGWIIVTAAGEAAAAATGRRVRAGRYRVIEIRDRRVATIWAGL